MLVNVLIMLKKWTTLPTKRFAVEYLFSYSGTVDHVISTPELLLSTTNMGNVVCPQENRPVDDKKIKITDRNEQSDNKEQVVRSHRDLTTVSSLYIIPSFLLKIIKRR
ncbi:hypothetical protein RUM44_004932 [Polyplax serrata]|uniref:Uncharacterized protein n=1 Tax=Polyplax serrata TaxID=468196 RepID=A0ABR1AWK2_POLSC